ncbi:hypothetical protein CD29_08415 [Ureibacillus manganicus DSM 26584]|uniref:Uncharacterized protein n=1 Tax=Ureibacillus manganicus DSM 26584 TaxID=1384049 RepID=A0A0A3I672_9BACL|nr:hypothetical protein CD29_08415 [Ureibacillus manganicus DSM 26584]
MDYLIAVGLILFGFLALFITIFKYTKTEHGDNFDSGSTFSGFVFSLILSLLPWWFTKTILILISIGVIFIGVMILITM